MHLHLNPPCPKIHNDTVQLLLHRNLRTGIPATLVATVRPQQVDTKGIAEECPPLAVHHMVDFRTPVEEDHRRVGLDSQE